MINCFARHWPKWSVCITHLIVITTLWISVQRWLSLLWRLTASSTAKRGCWWWPRHSLPAHPSIRGGTRYNVPSTGRCQKHDHFPFASSFSLQGWGHLRKNFRSRGRAIPLHLPPQKWRGTNLGKKMGSGKQLVLGILWLKVTTWAVLLASSSSPDTAVRLSYAHQWW